MQQSSLKNNHLRVIGVHLLFFFSLGIISPPGIVWAEETVLIPQPAMADPPDFLAPAPTGKDREGARGAAIIPFIGTNKGLTLLPTPERPAIASSDVIPLERPEVTAGVNVDLGNVKFNLGYTLPSGKVNEFVRPLGVELEPGSDVKRFSLGVKIPF